MQIIRFQDAEGNIRLGSPRDAGTAQIVESRGQDVPVLTDRVAAVARVLAPVEPADIFCIGLNYRRHAQETGQELPKNPVLFMKPRTAVQHPGGPIRLPGCCDHGPEVDYEGELAVVIGRAGRDIPEARALEHVLGYTVGIDVSARRWQKHGGGGQYIRGKGFDTFCPLGPVLITADEIPDPQTLRITTTLDGNGRDHEIMQDSNTGDMIYTVAQLIAFISQDTTLAAGTVILTGTPEGVGVARKPPVFLQPGDAVTVEIEKIGRLSCPVEVAD